MLYRKITLVSLTCDIRHREGFKVIDNRPESLVFVEGSETQALFNFLLNCRSCIATTGAQAGVPPTILAPVAFRSAVLKAMKVSMRDSLLGKWIILSKTRAKSVQ